MAGISAHLLTGGKVEPIQRLFALAAAAQAQTPEAFRQALALQLAPLLFAPQNLHPDMQALWAPHVSKLARVIAVDDGFFVDSAHGLRQLSHWLCTYVCLWHPADDKSSRDFITTAHTLLACCEKLQAGTAPSEPMIQLLANTLATAEKHQKRASLAAQRLRDNELSQMRIATAQARVVALLDRHLAYRPLPCSLIPHLQSTLKGELQHLVLTHEQYAKQPFWQLWERLLPVLGRCFSTDNMTVGDQLLYQTIPPFLDELEQSLSLPMVDSAAYEQWVDQLSENLMLAIKKEDIACEKLAPLAETLGLQASAAKVTPALLAQLDALAIGDWFTFDGEHTSALRCQLALNEPDVDQLLFVDRNGRKILAKAKQDFAACLATDIAKPLKLENPEAVLMASLSAVAEQASEQQHKTRQRQVAEQARKARQLAKEKAAVQEKENQQRGARQAAAEKAMAEAKALKEAKTIKLREREAAAREAQKREVVKKHEQSVALVDAIQVGAWLQFSEQSPYAGKRGKLSVVIAKVGKYIFVDELGRKLAEFDREGLIDLLEQDRASLLRNGNNFDDQLAKVIKGLRRDSA